MTLLNGFPILLYIVPTIVLISFHVGDQFLAILCLHYLLCRVFSRVSSNSLLLVFTIGAVFAAEIMALGTYLPLLWRYPVNLLYMLLINCFLCHYLIWSVLEFSLSNIEHEILEIPTFSSLPTSCCLLITILGFGHWRKHMSSLICLMGVPTLWLCSKYKPKKHLEVLWNSFMEICVVVLLNLFPAINYTICYFYNQRDRSYFRFMVEILFLITTTNLISSVLHVQNMLTAKSKLNKWIFNVVPPVITGIILISLHTELLSILFKTPGYLSMFSVHFLLFLTMVSVTLLRYYHQSTKTQFLLKFMSVILCIIIVGWYWNTLSNVLEISRQPLWNKRFMNHLLWSGVLCLIFSLITLFTYEYRNQEIFDIIFGASLCNLHYSEWCLYMTVNISESWLYCSCIINIVSVLLTATYARQKHSKCKAFSITNQNASMIIFSWHVFAPCCLVPSVLKLLLLWINKYIYDSTNHNILDHRIVYEKGFVLGLYLLILGFACSERIYLFGKQIVDHLLKIFPCLLPIRIVIQSLIMLAYFHVSTMLVWSQVTILYNSYAHLSLTSNIHILIQFLISCLMTSLALILPTLLNVNLLNFEISAISRYFCKIGLLLLSVTVNSMQLDLNLSGTLMYVAAVPTCIFCITWMACLFTCLPFYHTFTFRSLGVLTYQLGNVIYSGLSILSVLFSVMTMINMFPSNLFVYFIFSIFISCIVCLVIWDINNDDSLITGQFQCTYADHESGIMKTSVKNNISPLTNLSSHFVSVSFNNSRSQLALPNMFCDLCIRLILLVCSSVSILGLLTYLVHHFVEVSMNDIVCRLYTVFALKLFCTAQISVGYPQRWLCDKIYCRSTRLFTNSSNDVLRFILISVVNICVVISVILRFQFCSRSSTDIEIFFLPWIIFTLHGKHLNRCRSVFALTCFTILLLYMVFINSPIVKGAVPPLPTFDRQLFGGPSSSFSHWSEFLLTIALCPLHILFLADQSNLSTKVIVDLFFLNRFGQSHRQHIASSICLKCMKLRFMYILSHIFAHILCTAYALLPFCISYWFIASSFASAIFGFYSFIICIYLLLRVDIVTEYSYYYS